MLEPYAPFAMAIGTEEYGDCCALATVVFGASFVDDGNWPGDTLPQDLEVADPDVDYNNPNIVPNNYMIMCDIDKPRSIRDYPIRRCFATGQYGAPSAMVVVDGQWYLTRYAPAPRMAKKYVPRNRAG